MVPCLKPMNCPAAGIAMVQRDDRPCCMLGNQSRKPLVLLTPEFFSRLLFVAACPQHLPKGEVMLGCFFWYLMFTCDLVSGADCS